MKSIPIAFAKQISFVAVPRDRCANLARRRAPRGGANALRLGCRHREQQRACARSRHCACPGKPAAPCKIQPGLTAVSARRRSRYERNAEEYFYPYWFIAAARAARAGVRDPRLLASKVMTSVLRCFKRSKGIFAHYFSRALRRRIASALRSESSRRLHELPLPQGFEITFHIPKKPGVSAELQDVVQQALRKLRPQDRKLFVLRFWNGCTCAEVADETRLTESAVANRLSRAYAKLRRSLAGYIAAGSGGEDVSVGALSLPPKPKPTVNRNEDPRRCPKPSI